MSGSCKVLDGSRVSEVSEFLGLLWWQYVMVCEQMEAYSIWLARQKLGFQSLSFED